MEGRWEFVKLEKKFKLLTTCLLSVKAGPV